MDWRKHVNKKVHGYSRSNHNTTGFLPFYLFFGRHPLLPVVIVLPNKRGEEESKSRVFYTAYVTEWKKRLEEAYHVASRNISKSAKRGKSNYDSKGYSLAVLNVGDHVLVRNLLEKGGPGKNCDPIGSRTPML